MLQKLESKVLGVISWLVINQPHPSCSQNTPRFQCQFCHVKPGAGTGPHLSSQNESVLQRWWCEIEVKERNTLRFSTFLENHLEPRSKRRELLSVLHKYSQSWKYLQLLVLFVKETGAILQKIS